MSIFDFKSQTAETEGTRHELAPRRSPTHLLALFVLLFDAWCPLPTGYSLPAPGGRYEVREIKPHVFVWIPEDIIDQDGDPEFTRAATAGFIVASDAVVVVDTTNSPFHARELLYEIRRRTDAPVKYVVNTGSGRDRALGNEVFLDQQASIVSTSAAQAAIRQYQQQLPHRLEGDWRLQARMRGIHPTLPSQTFEGELRLNLSGQEIKLLSLPAGNSTGDLMVYLPEAKVLYLGGLYANGYFPRIDSRDIGGWIETLKRVENWDVETFIPGQGEPGGKKELAEFRSFLIWLTREVEKRIQEGKSLDQVKHDLASGLENYHWHAPELAPGAVEAAYQQFAGPQQAAPPAAKSGNPL